MPGLSIQVPLSLADHRLRVVPAEPGQQKQVSHEIHDVRLGHMAILWCVLDESVSVIVAGQQGAGLTAMR